MGAPPSSHAVTTLCRAGSPDWPNIGGTTPQETTNDKNHLPLHDRGRFAAWSRDRGDGRNRRVRQYVRGGLALGKDVKTDCTVSETIDGKTYCFGNETAKTLFMKDPHGNLAKAQQYYSSKH